MHPTLFRALAVFAAAALWLVTPARAQLFIILQSNATADGTLFASGSAASLGFSESGVPLSVISTDAAIPSPQTSLATGYLYAAVPSDPGRLVASVQATFNSTSNHIIIDGQPVVGSAFANGGVTILIRFQVSDDAILVQQDDSASSVNLDVGRTPDNPSRWHGAAAISVTHPDGGQIAAQSVSHVDPGGDVAAGASLRRLLPTGPVARLTAGVTYTLEVSAGLSTHGEAGGTASGSAAASTSLRLLPAACPTVFLDPHSPSICRNGAVSLLALADGDAPLTHRWQIADPEAPGGWRDLADGPLAIAGAPAAMLTGASSPTLTIDRAGFPLAFQPVQLRCTASNTCGQSASPATTLAACNADWDCGGSVNSSDIASFITTWLADLSTGALASDINNDGAVNSTDISAFISAWLHAVQNGC